MRVRGFGVHRSGVLPSIGLAPTGSRSALELGRYRSSIVHWTRSAALVLALVAGTDVRAYQVQLNIVDQTGAPLDARVHALDAAGVHYPGGPDAGLISHRDTWMRGFFYPGSSVTMEIAPGVAQFTAGHGFDYRPATITPNVQSDTTFTLVVRRYLNVEAAGWYGGDVHAHSIHLPSDYDVTPEGVLRIVEAEDLSMTWVLDGLHEFSGGPHPLSTPEHVLYFSTEYRNQTCGHVSMLGLRGNIGSSCCSAPNPVYPLLSDFREMWNPTSDQAMVLCHPCNGGGFFDQGDWPAWGLGREAPLLASSGNLDAYDIASYSNVGDIELDNWYGFLNSGVRVPASAGTDAMANRYWGRSIGGYRVYVQCDTLTPGAWVEGLRAGRTFVTNYPLIPEFTVQGLGPGSTVELADPDTPLAIHYKIQSTLPASKAEIIVNGEVARVITLPTGGVVQSVIGNQFLEIEKSSWIALRVTGNTISRHANSLNLFAHTSPVYVEVQDTPIRRTNRAADFIDWADSLRILVEQRGNWPSQAIRTQVHARINQSEAYYRDLFVAPPSAVSLLGPAFGDTVNATEPLAFVWQEAEDVEEGDRFSYRFEVRELNSSTPLFSVETPDTVLVTEFDEVGTHEWKVTTIDLGNNETECEGSWRLIAFDPTCPVFVRPPTPPEGVTLVVTPGELVSFDLLASDADGDDVLAIDHAGLPPGADFTCGGGNPASCQFSWTPGPDDLGTYPLTFTATDLRGCAATTNLVVICRSFDFADATESPLDDAGYGRGAAWNDHDNDGDLDLFVANHSGVSKLFLNDEGVFIDATAPPLDDPGNGQGVAWGDYDNDGEVDLYLSDEDGPNRLFHNDGTGFSEVAAGTPLADQSGAGRAVAWADYDNDGDLDLYLANHVDAIPVPDRLFENDSTGFVDTGLCADTESSESATWGDYDNDGHTDLFVANYNGPNRLYRNLGDGTFADVAPGTPIEDSGLNVAAAWADYDNDGDLDLYVVRDNLANRLFRNDVGSFVEVGDETGVAEASQGRGIVWADFDLDADLDLYVINANGPGKLFCNDGNGSFIDASIGSVLAEPANSFGVTAGDYDRDGDPDLYVSNSQSASKLFRNGSENGNHWVQFRLVGARANRSGIGARITVVADGITQIREVSGGSGGLSQNSLIAEFGLGTATEIEWVRVEWMGPDTTIDEVGDLAADSRYDMYEGAGGQVVGACCVASGTCRIDTEAGCSSTADEFLGVGTSCEPNLCPCPAATPAIANQQKVNDTTGGFEGSLEDGDNFGQAVASPGDLSGDSVNDLVVGASFDGGGVPSSGAVWALFLDPIGTVHGSQKITAGEGGFTGVLHTNDEFGDAVASMPGFGGPEGSVAAVAVGAPKDDDGGGGEPIDISDKGAVWILFLDESGTVVAHQKISEEEAGLGSILHQGDHFGSALAYLGDLDGNGVGDLAVGAFQDDDGSESDGGENRGAVWILFLKPGEAAEHVEVDHVQKISHTQGGLVGQLDPDDRFGRSLACLGDLDGDEVPDLLVGADGDDDGAQDAGAAWVLFLTREGTVKTDGYRKISASSGDLSPGALHPDNGFGASAALVGDWDEDGVDDVAIGGNLDDDSTDGPGERRGAIWLVLLNSDGTVKCTQKISETEGGFLGDLDDNDYFGTSVAAMGNLDGDGVPDLVIGANGDDDSGTDAGTIWMLLRRDVADVSGTELSSIESLRALPNPSAGTIRFQVPRLRGKIEIFDSAGRLMRRVIAETSDGTSAPAWDGKDRFGREVPVGVYLARWVDGPDSRSTTLIRLRRR